MIAELIAGYAKECVTRYRAFISELSGELHRTLNSNSPTSPRARYDFEMRAKGLAKEMIRAESVMARVMADTLITKAVGSIELSREDVLRLNDAKNFAIRQTLAGLEAQAGRDAYVPNNVLIRLAIETEMLSRTSRVTHVDALLRMKKTFGNDLMKFTFVDRAGRKWDSLRYVETMIRSLLLDSYNEAAMFAMSTRGINQAKISSPNKDYDGMRFRFVENDVKGVLPIYSEIKSVIFHPNSHSFVIPE